jgi:hypothetical protein
MHEAERMPPQAKSVPWMVICIILVGVAVVAAVAGGTFWYLVHLQMQRLTAELDEAWPNMDAAQQDALIEDFAKQLSVFRDSPSRSTETKSVRPPTKGEVAAYLDGKTLPLPEGDTLRVDQGEKSNRSCVMTEAGVEAVEWGNDHRLDDQRWSTFIVFVYNTGDAYYAVDADLLHQQGGGVYGVTLKKVARQ